ncbi:hypothetical protein LNKW23_37260 [Paralimibaculum aggregatum]|uniref:Uncharacterized protein n=1 Tax=Paralimibaculum aggregatum TaxID=3036245 RepID=A0ABQ6LMU2_9RHOB|nr:hypothetical protein LNKW23_37260 [Limibaculum sp. NKW23]
MRIANKAALAQSVPFNVKRPFAGYLGYLATASQFWILCGDQEEAGDHQCRDPCKIQIDPSTP